MIWSTVLEIIECDRLKLVIMGHFSPFYHPLSSKPNKSEIWRNEEKKKIAGDIIILHMCTKNTIIWGTVREIQSETDRIFCHLWSSFTPYNPQNQNFEKMKKVIAYVIILHMCTINHDHICFLRYKARQDFLSFWAIFCPLTLLTTRKIKILKKWHKHAWRYYHCTHVYHKWQSH